MKLCITATGKGLHDSVDTSFGRAPYLLIVNTETSTVEPLPNRGLSAQHGAGIAAAQLISDKGAECLLTGSVGPKAFAALQSAGIKIFESVAPGDTVKESLIKFGQGKFHEATMPSRKPGAG
jgi:predicted Fe-Mo cluster-binding NifX family protein